MSTNSDSNKYLKCILAREKAFRHYYSSSSYEDKVRNMPRERGGEHWDSVLNPEKGKYNTKDQFRTLDSYIPGLFRFSSQLGPKRLRDFLHRYPLGFSTEEILQQKDPPKMDEILHYSSYYPYHLSSETEKEGMNEYDPMVDAALLLNELEFPSTTRERSNNQWTVDFKAAAGGDEWQDEKEGKYDRGLNSTKDVPSVESAQNIQTGSEAKVPTLQSLVEQKLRPAILQKAYELESEFVNDLADCVGIAERLFQSTMKIQQKELENSKEANEVRRIRILLQEAEEKLKERQNQAEKIVLKERDTIQGDLDQKRAFLALRYNDDRNALLELAPGHSLCMGCTEPYYPRQRTYLSGWERCQISGCNSVERLCPNCSAVPCTRCFAPTCVFHKIEHEVDCSAECKKCCGFNPKAGRISLESGCCGGYNEYAMGSCKYCKAGVCSDCRYNEESESSASDDDYYDMSDEDAAYPTLCPTCSRRGKTCKRPIQWSLPEYERERKRRNIVVKDLRDEHSNFGSFCLPINKQINSSVEWIQEQEQIHKKWSKERLNNPTKDEKLWASVYFERSGRNSWFWDVDNLSLGGFADWIKEKHAEKVVIEALMWGYDDEVDAGELSDRICPCERCKRKGKRPKLEHKLRLDRKLTELNDEGQEDYHQMLKQLLSLTQSDLVLLKDGTNASSDS